MESEILKKMKIILKIHPVSFQKRCFLADQKHKRFSIRNDIYISMNLLGLIYCEKEDLNYFPVLSVVLKAFSQT